MRCYNCNAIAKCQCRDCQKWVCRSHANVIFNDQTRAFANLCGACYSKERRLAWQRERTTAKVA